MLADERLELADEVPVPSALELGLDPLLERGEAQLLEPRDLGWRERLECQIRERRGRARAPSASRSFAVRSVAPSCLLPSTSRLNRSRSSCSGSSWSR